MFFYCKDCNIEFEVDDKECEGYYNWKCPECQHISVKKDMALGLGIIWNCDTGTTKKKAYIEGCSSGGSGGNSSCCSGCKHNS